MAAHVGMECQYAAGMEWRFTAGMDCRFTVGIIQLKVCSRQYTAGRTYLAGHSCQHIRQNSMGMTHVVEHNWQVTSFMADHGMAQNTAGRTPRSWLYMAWLRTQVRHRFPHGVVFPCTYFAVLFFVFRTFFYFAGSLMVTETETFMIDPEFAFYGVSSNMITTKNYWENW